MNFVQLVIMVVIAGIFALIFGIRYLQNKENMALIERNKDLKEIVRPNSLLTLGIILIGGAIGLFVGVMLTTSIIPGRYAAYTFFMSIMFFAGLSFIVAYYFAKKHNN